MVVFPLKKAADWLPQVKIQLLILSIADQHTRHLREEFGNGDVDERAVEGKFVEFLKNPSSENNAFTLALVWQHDRMMLITKVDNYSEYPIDIYQPKKQSKF
jgi:hypothetical protein